MLLSAVHSQIKTSRLNNIFSADFVPLQVSSVLLSCNADVVAVYDKLVLLNVSLNCAVELAVHCIILQHVSHVVNRQKVVDTYNNDVILVSLFERSTENETTDTAKTVNTNFNHLFVYFKGLK
ncbi:glyceraldehyde-3-phosphate dehydrogenase [Prevotella sp. CAG:1124]|nr:glyceraldehyde-3-phosphate dehydrogenase [Prevotella sp. CAG:1124]